MTNYNPFNTALTRTTLSKPTRELLSRNFLTPFQKILEFGAGKGFDTHFLSDNGFNIKGYDKYNPFFKNDSLLKDHYDVIFCNYVFNVISDLDEHEEVLNKLKEIGDTVYVTVRSDKKAVKNNWNWDEERQGYWTPKNTFQRMYDMQGAMVQILFGEVEYIVRNQSMLLFKVK